MNTYKSQSVLLHGLTEQYSEKLRVQKACRHVYTYMKMARIDFF